MRFLSLCETRLLSFLRTCLLWLLRIRSAHLEILGLPMGDAYQDSDIFARFKTISRRK